MEVVRSMGGYLNPGSDLFEMALRSQIFVDKSGLIEKTNRCVRTLQRYICVSRPRRFGKSMGVDMLAGEKARINTGTFSNDMTTFATKDDVLTLLVYLGYLTYDNEKETVEIPNREVQLIWHCTWQENIILLLVKCQVVEDLRIFV